MNLASAVWIADIGRSLRAAFFMFWVTLWPLILGFGLSGAVQAFISRDAMQRRLGDHRPPAVTRASVYGMVSSSCSYAASALSKSLFVKGADFIAANVFMFASTNLVIELGIVLAVLMGWQFAASEFVGGIIMIVLLVAVGSLYLRGRLVVQARQRLEDEESHVHPSEDAALEREPWRQRLRSKSGWADASAYTMSDLTMIRKELVIGYVVAGFLATLVPTSVWNAVFLHGHGFWTSLENVVVGPFIAIISFADLIAFPLLLIYRRFYGTRLALRMLAVFWAVMSTAGLITEGIFRAAGLVPTTRPATVVPAHFSFDYTTWLNIVFLVLFAVLYWTYRNRARFGAGQGYANDPVCGMQVEVLHAPATVVRDGTTTYFCSDHCATRFRADPGRFERGRAGAPAAPAVEPGASAQRIELGREP